MNMIPNDEAEDIGRSPQDSEKKNVASNLPNEKAKEGIAQNGTLATGDLVNQGLAVSDEESDASSKNIFVDPDVAAHYVSVYEKAHYECRHVFDPDLTWTKQEEKTVIRKLDWHVCMWACVMFFALQTDRGNLAQAIADNLLKDLHLTTNDYNVGNTVFLVSFLLAEVPSQLVSKKLGPDRWIPIQMVLWSMVAMSQCAITGKQSFLITRALLGILEGGFIPDIVLWLSYFYTGRELPIRLSYFWTTLSSTTVVTSLLAFAIFHLKGVGGWEAWRWLFLLEGLITLSIGIAAFFMMPASAVQTKKWFRPQGWFTTREVGIVVNRVLRDDPSKGDMHNRQAVTPRRLWNALKDYDMWPLYVIGLIAYIPQSPPNTYISLTLKSLGFSTFSTVLLQIPPNILHILTLILLTRLSDYLKERTLVSMIQNVWILPCVIALAVWPNVIKNAWGTYAVVCVLLSYPYCHAILVAWTSKNANNVGNRSISAAIYNMSVQVGNVVANFIYRADDAPLYRRGNRDLVVVNVIVIVFFLFTKAYYVLRNKYRDKQWNAMTQEERNYYIHESKDIGSKRLDFRFSH
ncbi:allantoate permease [Acephala macrosclerotiorum]|nr:allantoate permease [Acephala macrosclerotiorum]